MMIPRLVIGGIRSGEGKTTIALGLMAALRAQGLAVQGFKVGPDYLDTGYQALATGRPGRNIDLWMMSEHGVCNSLLQHGGRADIAIIEGVMGLFDGHRDVVTPTSTADVAKRLNAPVILVIDASHFAASVGAVALGYRTFDPGVQIAGAILNRWNPHRSRHAVECAMARGGVPVLGYLPPMPEIALPSRHLGLVVADEIRDQAQTALARLGELVAEFLDLDQFLTIARGAGDFAQSGETSCQDIFPSKREIHIGVAWDDAFAFYYPENLEMLEAAGAKIVYFSPLSDPVLPPVDGLYLGGGYPELHAERLAGNRTMCESIALAIADGLPTYAECGGLLYLCESLTDAEGCSWPMVGAVPRHVRMHRRLQRMGYREGILQQDCLLGHAGMSLRGHEFHYSSCDLEDDGNPAYVLDGQVEGFSRGNLFASYMHLHFTGYPAVVEHWIARCRERTASGSLSYREGVHAC